MDFVNKRTTSPGSDRGLHVTSRLCALALEKLYLPHQMGVCTSLSHLYAGEGSPGHIREDPAGTLFLMSGLRHHFPLLEVNAHDRLQFPSATAM